MSQLRLAADVGGTFTDVVISTDDGIIGIEKVLSSARFEQSILIAIEGVLSGSKRRPDEVAQVIHGTTVATNAVLERTGGQTALLTTLGFRDVLELRRLRMPDIYNIFWDKPLPLVPRHLRFELAERIGSDGTVIQSAAEPEVIAVLGAIVASGAESLAVCFLNSYRNPEHELLVERIAATAFPQLHLSVSHRILPEVGEFERSSTTVTNAYVMPVMARYLSSLSAGLADHGLAAPLLIMQSSGGTMTAAAAAKMPVRSLESGPAAGAIAARSLSVALGIPNAISFDMGGTTAKATLIEASQLRKAQEYEVGSPVSASARFGRGGGYPIKIRAIDIAEVGAGGGSIVAVDRGGSIQVGPASAGSNPGPIAYDLGGRDVTVTDANVVLGYLNQESLLDGRLRLNHARARDELRRQVGMPLGLNELEAAHAVHVIANTTMARALRAVSTERGRDSRNFTIIAFGGNGPVHAAQLASSLHVSRVIVPMLPGLFSAVGLLDSDVEQEVSEPFLQPLARTSSRELVTAFERLQTGIVEELAQQAVNVDGVTCEWSVDARYSAQFHELNVTVPQSAQDIRESISSGLASEHSTLYGHHPANRPIDLVTLRVTARIRGDWRNPKQSAMSRASVTSLTEARPTADRPVYFGAGSGVITTPVLGRQDLSAVPSKGPLIIEEYDSTIVVPPEWSAALLDPALNVVTLTRG